MIYQPCPNYALDPEGTIYIIQFLPAFKHAKYYTGFALDADKRFKLHCSGRGSYITQAALKQGIQLQIVAKLPGNRTLERLIKNQKNTPKIVERIQKGIYSYPYFYEGVIE